MRMNWKPTEHSRICSKHFISSEKNNDPASPDNVPSVFAFVDSPLKKKKRQNLKSYERRLKSKTRQSAAVQAQDENDSDSESNCDDEMIEPEADSSEVRLGEGQCNQVDDITVTAERIQLLET